MNELIILGVLVLVLVLLLILHHRENYEYNSYVEEQEDRANDESSKFLLYYRRMEKELKQKV